MSLDPVSHGLPPNLAAYVAGELRSLAHDARELQARLSTGDIVAAIVLPSNGLTDLIKIDGLRVAAELPPTVLPGESIVVEVTGFSDDRILLHIVPEPPPPEDAGPRPGAVDAELQSSQARSGQPAVAGTAARPSEAVPLEAGSRDVPIPAAQGSRPLLAARAATPAVALIEARLAAAYATSRPGIARSLDAAQNLGAAPNGGALSPAAAQRERQAPAAEASLPVARERGAGLASSALTRPFISQRVTATPVEARTAPAPPAVTSPPRSYTEPATLLRALQLPISAGNLGAARVALESPERLAPALADLEHALSTATQAHEATARTLLAFVARIEPRSPVLAAQIAAFVDHVVDGREVKLVQLLTAHAQAGPALSGGQSPPASTAAASAALTADDSIARERVALRQAGIETDLKSRLLSIAHETTVARSSDAAVKPMSTALGGALTALTALQLNAATALAANPDGVGFWLPVALPDGFARAQIQIDRKTPQAQNGALDGDNFHIGFVLETQHLGTVAIDLLTVGRSVSVGVKTESELARDAFGTALTQLQQRLEALNYRVAKADAGVAPRGTGGVEPQTAPDSSRQQPAPRLVDLDA